MPCIYWLQSYEQTIENDRYSTMRIILISLILLLAFAANSQEHAKVPQARFITKFKFTIYTGGVIIVKAHLTGVPDSLNFILDTGGAGISLDSATCSEFHIPTHKTDTLITGIGGKQKAHFVFDKSLILPGIEIKNLNFHVLDYSILSSTYGEKIDGIMGYSIFQRYIVKINYDKLEIELYSNGKFNYPQGGIMLYPLFSSLPIQPLEIRDARKINKYFYMDTGAGLCFLMSDKFVTDSAVLLKKRKPLITQAEGIAGMLQMKLTIIREVKIGKYKFKRVPTYIYEDKYNVTGYPFSGGLIGNEILRRFNVVFNYGQKEIHLKPNSHYNDPFDYSYTGLGIYAYDNRIVVEDIIKGSPAEAAGFMIGDEIISVATDFSGNLQVYKLLMQNAGKNVRMLIKRKNELMMLNLQPVTIR